MLCNGIEQKSPEARSGLILTSSRCTPLHNIRYGIFEMMNRIRKGQLHWVDKGEVKGRVVLVARLFGVVASAQQGKAFHARLISFSFLATQPKNLQEKKG